MVAAGAMWHRHSPDGDIYWLSHEATNAFHWAMRIAPYHPDGMAIKIVADLPAFFVSSIMLLATTIS
jgi:hypothetical protein